MSFDLSVRAKLLLQENNIQSQIIVEIDGIDRIFGAEPVFKLLRYGETDVKYGDGLVYGGGVEDPISRDFISLDGTTRALTQQLRQDKGGVGSIQNFNIRLLDKDGEVSSLLEDLEGQDILSREANVYIGFQGGFHPEDSVRIFNGLLSSIDKPEGYYNIVISHPERLKRRKLLPKIDSELFAAINNSQTSIQLKDASGMLLPQDALTTYVQIADEIIQYTGISSNTLTGCTRGQFGTIAVSHDIDTETSSYYRLVGDPIDLALKIMLSSEKEYFKEGIDVLRFDGDRVYFTDFNLGDNLGLTVGDQMRTFSSDIPGNNKLVNVIGFGVDGENSFILTDSNYTTEDPSPATASFKSQWNTLNFGCEMAPFQVDVAQHDTVKTLFGANFPEMDFKIREDINAKDFIEQELYYPVAAYQIPRKGRVSVGYTSPPIAEKETKIFDEDNIVNPTKIGVKRSINEKFYNSTIYRFGEDELEAEFKTSVVSTDENSLEQIPVGLETLEVDSKGLTGTQSNINFVSNLSKRILDRYRLAAEVYTIEVNYGDGFSVEVGDTAIYRGPESNGLELIVEVTNKSIDFTTGKTKLQLTDTAFGSQLRYGTFSPANTIVSGSTTTSLVIEKTQGQGPLEAANEKWSDYIGQKVLVRSKDFAFQEETVLVSIDPVNSTKINVEALSSAPSAGYVIECPSYDGEDKTFWKALHCFNNPRVQVTSGISQTQFIVDGSDIGKFFVGTVVNLHTANFAVNSEQLEVIDITGTTITLEEALGFTPNSNYFVDLIGFSSDNGKPYAWL